MLDSESILKSAGRTLDMEAQSIQALKGWLGDDFVKAVNTIHHSPGRTVVTGIGKSAIIAQKIVATMNSTGTPALYMHAADAIHGDLGMIQKDDVVICISKSGNSPEIKALTPIIKRRGNTLIGLVGNDNSHLYRDSNIVLRSDVSEEACPHNLAPTTSTTAQLAMGDALAVCLLQAKGFKREDFAESHPGGQLGKSLYTTLGDLAKSNEKPSSSLTDNIPDIIYDITHGRLGATVVLDKSKVVGIITDGDIRRMLEKSLNFQTIKAGDIMTPNPITVKPSELAKTGASMIKNKKINHLVLEDEGQYQGIVHLQDLAREGFLLAQNTIPHLPSSWRAELGVDFGR